jgi:flagellar biosynthesis/type III secretory pathway M-ring protein FliF/YscJ
VVKELAVAVEKMNDLIKSSDELLGSSEWDRRVRQVNESADERMKMAAEQSQQVVNNFFWRVYAALGILFVMLIICLATAFVLMRRLVMRLAGNTAGLRSEGDHTANDKAGPGANAGGAGREGGSE